MAAMAVLLSWEHQTSCGRAGISPVQCGEVRSYGETGRSFPNFPLDRCHPNCHLYRTHRDRSLLDSFFGPLELFRSIHTTIEPRRQRIVLTPPSRRCRTKAGELCCQQKGQRGRSGLTATRRGSIDARAISHRIAAGRENHFPAHLLTRHLEASFHAWLGFSSP